MAKVCTVQRVQTFTFSPWGPLSYDGYGALKVLNTMTFKVLDERGARPLFGWAGIFIVDLWLGGELLRMVSEN